MVRSHIFISICSALACLGSAMARAGVAFFELALAVLPDARPSHAPMVASEFEYVGPDVGRQRAFVARLVERSPRRRMPALGLPLAA